MDYGSLLERSVTDQIDFVNMTITMRDPSSGQLVKMDLGPADVHINAALNNYVSGFRNAEFKADEIAPVAPVTKQSNFYFEFNQDNAFSPVGAIESVGGSDPTEINPQLSSSDKYVTRQYALASILTPEMLANADAPLNIELAATKMLMDKLLLSREVRVQAMATNASNYNTGAQPALVKSIAAGAQWDGGATSNPVRDIKSVMEASLMLPTDMIMSFDTWNAFTENPAVQKYVAYKSGVRPMPEKSNVAEWAALLELPRPHVCAARTKNSAGAYPFIWSSHVVLVHRPAGDAVNMFDVSTFKTFRWNGAGGPNLPTEFGGTVQGGFTVRSFFDPFRGVRGRKVIIVAHNDAEIVTGGIGQQALVGGLIQNAFQ